MSSIRETNNTSAKSTEGPASPIRQPPRRLITPPRVRKHPKPHFFPPHMRDHLRQSTPRTGPISTKLNFGSLVIRSRVTKSTAVPRAKAASLAIRSRRSAPCAADPSESLPNGKNDTNTPQAPTPQINTMAIDSSAKPATQAQDTTTDVATTDIAMANTAGDQSEQLGAEPRFHQREIDGRNFDFYY